MPPRVVPVTTLDDPALEVYRNQKDAWLRARHGPGAGESPTGLPDNLFMAEGLLVVEQLLESPHELVSCLVDETRVEQILPGLADRDVPVYAGPRALLTEVVGYAMHRGVLACGRRVPAGDALELARASRTLVILEDLANHDNVGGVFRAVAALAPRPAGVILSPRCCDPLYRKALRVSMGHALRVPFAFAEDWPGDLARIRGLGFRVAALTTTGSPIHGVPPAERWALLLGAEGPGLTPQAIAHADVPLTIPMQPGVDSLNVVVAGAIALASLHQSGG